MGSAEHTTHNASGTLHHAAHSTSGGLHQATDAAGNALHDAGEAIADAPRQVAAKTQGNPLAAGLIAFGAGLLVSSLIPPSEKEREAADAERDHGLHARHQVFRPMARRRDALDRGKVGDAGCERVCAGIWQNL